MRGVGITAAAASAIPEAVVPLLIVVTGFGDPVFLAVLVVALYWAGPRFDLVDRRDGATVVAITFVALAATLLLKTGFSLPRPPSSVMLIPEDGAGFPSGHTTGATATYTAVAIYLKRGTRRVRYGLATAAFVIVALSRVLLGVHYLVDVVTGIGVGLLTVAAVRWVASDSLSTAFAMAVPLAFGGAVLDLNVESGLQVGLVTGGAIGWWLARERISETPISLARMAIAAVVGGLLVGIGFESGGPIVAGFAGAGAGALFVALPALNGR